MSSRYVVPTRRAVPSGYQQSTYRQRPRTYIHSQLFWFKMAVGFNSVANEQVTAYSEAEGFDALVRGGWTDLQAAQVQFLTTQGQIQWSSQQIHVRSILGNSNQVNPMQWWGIPWWLEARNTIKGSWANTGSEAAGTVCFYAEKQAMVDLNGKVTSLGDEAYEVRRSQTYWIQLDLSKTTATTDPVNNDLLILGATTNAESSAIIGQITNETTNYAWSSQQIPLRAMAGVDGQPQPIMRYHRPYLLPANVKLRANINTGVTGQYMEFLCERIYA